MRIANRVEYVWSERQDRYIVVRKKSIIWIGKIAVCKGASAQQNQLAQSQTDFYNTLSQDYGTQFANQNAILSTLTKSLNPIIAAGPNQFGFSKGETNALNSEAIQGTGQQYNNASQTLRANQAALGGGNSMLPSGVASQESQQLATAGANQGASELLGIQNAGWQQGYNMYESAVGQLGGVAGMYNPNGVAGAANGAGSAAGSSWNQIAQENQAADPWNAILGAVGGAAGSFLGGKAFANMTGGSSGN